jgi:hypothetical protein
MPKIDEFFKKPEILHKKDLELIPGTKPCGKCKKDAEQSFWDPSTFTMSWKCPDGHDNQYKVN